MFEQCEGSKESLYGVSQPFPILAKLDGKFQAYLSAINSGRVSGKKRFKSQSHKVISNYQKSRQIELTKADSI